MTRRKKPYVPPKPARGAAPGARDAAANPIVNRAVAINLEAMTGRAGIMPGLRVRIAGGLYEGESATVESIAGGVIPAAVVRTDAGLVRRIRTIDLVAEPKGESPSA